MLLNTILNTDCVTGMRSLLPDEMIPLTVTSPPYDRLRRYGGHPFDFETIAEELFRITMPGGVVVWVVRDQIVDGGETGTSSYQRLYFKRIGFCLYHTLVMNKYGSRSAGNVRYGTVVEHAFVLSKGRPRTINLIRDRANLNAGRTRNNYIRRTVDGELEPAGGGKMTPPFGYRTAVWSYAVGRHTAKEQFVRHGHPALMPEKMAEDHIRSWSKPGDLVFDPMAGGGTTLKMALLNERRYFGMEIVPEYCKIAAERLRLARELHKSQLDEWLTLAVSDDAPNTPALEER